ncbi:MAG: hypothetical protein EXR29_03810 [Betaproteobacteria bacterium]|nr:hypothetical protein [Betaproteobacteria bacterium]
MPRRLDEERPERPRPTIAAPADVRQLSLSPRRFLSDYSSRVGHQQMVDLQGAYHKQIEGDGLFKGESFNLDFHSIPYYGELPRHLVFDSTLTTLANLARLDKMGITFMTLRGRSPGLKKEVALLPASAFREVELDVPTRKFRFPAHADRHSRGAPYRLGGALGRQPKHSLGLERFEKLAALPGLEPAPGTRPRKQPAHRVRELHAAQAPAALDYLVD